MGVCSCSPEMNHLLTTTSGLVFPTPGEATVCVVQLQIDRIVPADVDENGIIEQADIDMVESSAEFRELSEPSGCDPMIGCGRLDVNGDGKVNSQDSLSISQSASLPTPVPCGGLYAKTFQCGSSAMRPVIPTSDITFDSIVYFNDDGLSSRRRLRQETANDSGITDGIAVQLDGMDERVRSQARRNAEIEAVVSGIRAQQEPQPKSLFSGSFGVPALLLAALAGIAATLAVVSLRR